MIWKEWWVSMTRREDRASREAVRPLGIGELLAQRQRQTTNVGVPIGLLLQVLIPAGTKEVDDCEKNESNDE